MRYDGSFAADRDGDNARLSICCPEGGEISLGFCSLMPQDTYMGHEVGTLRLADFHQ